MVEINLLGMSLNFLPKSIILEEIKKYIANPDSFIHILSINPENLVIASENKEFNQVVKTAQIIIPDGMGIVMAARLKGVRLQERITGVDLMKTLMDYAGKMRLTALLIGGRPLLAESIAKCYLKKYPEAKFIGTIGFSNIKNPKKNEEKKIFDIVRRNKPHFIFAAFGSPDQELWLARHEKQLKGIICMGVGQGFDVIGGIVKRAPKWMQNIGLEWLYRLIIQPWRWRRQLRLLKFIWLLLRQP